MLNILLHQVNEEFQCQPYLRSLYQTLFCITYYGLLRVSEVTTGHPILAKDVQVALNKKKILLVLRTSKTHGKNNFPQMIKISAANIKLPWEKKPINDNFNNYCPYQLIQEFVQFRGNYRNEDEPFFIFSDKTAISARQMSSVLKTVIHNARFNEKLYGTHSLRAGRTCDLFKLGLSIENIKKLGHWKSNAIYCYLRNYS